VQVFLHQPVDQALNLFFDLLGNVGQNLLFKLGPHLFDAPFVSVPVAAPVVAVPVAAVFVSVPVVAPVAATSLAAVFFSLPDVAPVVDVPLADAPVPLVVSVSLCFPS
jgi:hypothetical protein